MHCGERVREREWGGLGWEAEEDRGPERKRRRGSSISRRRRRVIARHLLITDNCRSGKLCVFALSGSQHHAHVSVPSLCRGVCASCCGFILLGENSCCFTQWSFFFFLGINHVLLIIIAPMEKCVLATRAQRFAVSDSFELAARVIWICAGIPSAVSLQPAVQSLRCKGGEVGLSMSWLWPGGGQSSAVLRQLSGYINSCVCVCVVPIQRHETDGEEPVLVLIELLLVTNLV